MGGYSGESLPPDAFTHSSPVSMLRIPFPSLCTFCASQEHEAEGELPDLPSFDAFAHEDRKVRRAERAAERAADHQAQQLSARGRDAAASAAKGGGGGAGGKSLAESGAGPEAAPSSAAEPSGGGAGEGPRAPAGSPSANPADDPRTAAVKAAVKALATQLQKTGQIKGKDAYKYVVRKAVTKGLESLDKGAAEGWADWPDAASPLPARRRAKLRDVVEALAKKASGSGSGPAPGHRSK